MFSRRTDWNRSPNRLTAALRARREQGLPVFDLTESNPTCCGFHYPETTIRAALDQDAVLHYEPSPLGMPQAREAVARYYERRGVSVSPDRVALTSGTSEAYSHLFRLLTDPGDEVLTAAPSYPLLDFLADLNDVRLVRYPLHYESGWHINLDAIERAITPRSRVLAIVSPNNPAGCFLKAGELEGLVDLCAPHGLALVVDEVFADYAWRPVPFRAPSAAVVTDCLTFTLNGLSKSAALPQMKLGWIVANGPPDLLSEALSRLEIIADTYLSVGTPAQCAAAALLEQAELIRPPILKRIRENNDLLDSFLDADCPCDRLAAEGGWYAVARIPEVESDEDRALDLLENQGVFVHPGGFYDFPSGAHLVLSLITPPKAFAAGLERLFENPALRCASAGPFAATPGGPGDGTYS